MLESTSSKFGSQVKEAYDNGETTKYESVRYGSEINLRPKKK